MKEKILEQLKAACGKSTSISDRTLDTLAAFLSTGITEETEIPAAIEQYKPILTDIDGNINAVAAEAVKSVKPVDPPKNPIVPPIPPIPPTPEEPEWFKKHREAQEAKALELEEKVLGIEKSKQTETLIASAKTEFYTKYQVSDAEKALCEKSLDLHLKMNPTPDSTENIINGWKSQYEDIRSAQGLGGLEPFGSSSGGGQDGAGKETLSGLKEKLQKEGKIPQSQN